MKKDKLRNLDLRYFLLPFFILIALFFTMTYLNVDRRIKERYSRFENEAVSIAESYLHAILYSSDAHNIIEDLLDEKLRLAIHAISMIEDKYDNNVLSLIGERFLLDEIYLYNSQAEIIYSKDGRYLGWKAYEGHPVFDFYKGDKTVLVDDIRKDAESDEYYKYAYIKNEDGSFIQIGILSDTIQSFLQRFEIKELLNTLSNRSDIYDVVFINTDLELISGKTDSYSDILLEDEKIKEKILNGRHFTQRTIMKGQDVFLACVPVFYDGEIRGSFSVIWFTKELDAEVSKMIAESIVLFIAVIVILGTLLYYAYIKNKANIQIAYYDKLTGLPNYEFLIEFLDYEIRNMADEQKAIMLINCKNINFINMTYGFIYGNRILEEITKRIKEYIKPEDKLFRFGADRFVIFVADYRRKEELAELARGIVKIFDRPLSVSDNEQSIAEQYIDIQISIAEIKESCLSADRLLQDATLALDYINKNYSEQICFYEDIMEMSVYRQDRIEKALRAAINKRDNSSLYLQYQPKMSLKDNSLMGFEALARLNIDGMGSISPAEFINIAENMFLIYDLGKHILSEACRFLKRANDRLSSQHKRIKVSVNISVIQLLREEFVRDLIKIIKLNKIDKGTLVLEITESVIMENFDLVNERLRIIKEHGILIALDDFGTGFSSLSRLRDLNIDYVKIDKHFIDNITSSNEDTLITADIISMSHKFNLTVIAEGVETEEQKKYLEKYGCDIFQGYLISRPLDEAKAINFMSDFYITDNHSMV